MFEFGSSEKKTFEKPSSEKDTSCPEPTSITCVKQTHEVSSDQLELEDIATRDPVFDDEDGDGDGDGDANGDANGNGDQE